MFSKFSSCDNIAAAASASSHYEKNQNIQVFVRVRPLNQFERTKLSLSVLDCPGSREIVVRERSASNLTKTFTFDRVFSPTSKQIDVYKYVVSPLLDEVLLGYNCTVFAYGQTGTGKTFTMEGERSKDTTLTWANDPLSGIVPRAMSQLFDDLRVQNAEFTIRVSLLELYNEELYDLLAPNEDSKLKTLRLYEDSARKGSVIIQGLEEVTVHSKHEVYQIMEKGTERRRTAATLMNASSSRSHTVFTVTVHIKESNMEGEELLKIGKLHLVDLAGSENIGRSGAVDKRAREAGNINQSLLTLGRVITALVERTPHIPYRESKLTRLLQDSLGGKTKTSIIATVSPASINVEETLSTLDYAHRAKNIQNRPEINQKLTKRAMLKEFTEEIERLRRDLAATREKNGVFVDKENYEHMMARLASQDQDLSDKITHTRGLQESLEKKEEELLQKQMELQESKDDLDAANCLIADYKTKLQQVQIELRNTQVAKQEQEHLVEKHVLTESKLNNEATTLLTTADIAMERLDRLHSKLERKRTVEQTNLEAGRRLKNEIAEQLNEISEGIDGFRNDHASFCGLQRMKLDTFLEGKQAHLDEFRGSIKLIEDSLKNVSSQAAKLITEQNQRVLSLEDQSHVAIEKNCQETLGILNKVVELIVDTELNGVSDTIEGLQTSIDNLVEDFKAQIFKQNDMISHHVKDSLKQLKKHEKDWNTYLSTQNGLRQELSTSLGQQKQDTQKFTEDFVTTVHGLQEGLEKALRDVSIFKDNTLQGYTFLADKLEGSVQLEKKQVEKAKKNIETEKNGVNKFCNESCRQSNLATSHAEEQNNQICQVIREEHTKLESARGAIKENVEAQKVLVDGTLSILQDGQVRRRNYVTEFNTQFENNSKQLSLNSEKLSNEVQNFGSQGLEQDDSLVSQTKADMEEHCNQFYEWSEGQRSSVFEQAGKVREFWDTTYLIDLPTGATPHKQAFNYPRNLSATSPHDRILRRFRAARPDFQDDDVDEDRENHF